MKGRETYMPIFSARDTLSSRGGWSFLAYNALRASSCMGLCLCLGFFAWERDDWEEGSSGSTLASPEGMRDDFDQAECSMESEDGEDGEVMGEEEGIERDGLWVHKAGRLLQRDEHILNGLTTSALFGKRPSLEHTVITDLSLSSSLFRPWAPVTGRHWVDYCFIMPI
jgi:hypothetical protein